MSQALAEYVLAGSRGSAARTPACRGCAGSPSTCRSRRLDVVVDLGAQLFLDALAHHRALLARNGQHVLLGIGVDRLAEGDVEILAGPVRVPALAIAHLEVIDAKLARQVAGRLLERRVGRVVGGDDAAVDAERRRDQGVAEQQALDLGERQHATDLAVALGEQVVRAVAEGARAARPAIRRGGRTCLPGERGRTRSRPGGRIPGMDGPRQLHAPQSDPPLHDCGGWSSPGLGLSWLQTPKTSSMRPQLKSLEQSLEASRASSPGSGNAGTGT